MAKKKTQFKGAKYKDGILSYNYLGGKGGKGGGNVSIKQQGDDWYFVGKDGEIRTDVGDAGKLTPTHMKNLRDDGIFDAVPKEKLPVNSGGKIDPNPGGAKPPIELAESNYSLPETSAPASQASKDFTPVTGDPTAKRSGAIAENAPATFVSAPTAASGINPNEATQIAPASGGVTTSNFGGGREMGIGNNTFSSAPNQTMTSSPHATTVWQGSTTAAPNSAVTGIYGPPGSDNSNMTGTGWQEPNRFSTSEAQQSFSPPGASSTSNNFSASSAAQGPPSVVNNPGSEFGEQGPEGGPIIGGEDFDASPEGATSAVPGIGGKDDSSWGAADWNAVGSVMKGVGGLASAYTGIKNYQLARDAHNTQKNQWQANYNQRLKAYEDNKKMANQDIEARNRTLAARGNTSAKYEKL